MSNIYNTCDRISLEKLQVGVLASGFILRVMGGEVAPTTPKLIELAI